MTSRNRVLTSHERRREVAAVLAIAVRRIVQDTANSKVLSTDVSNRPFTSTAIHNGFIALGSGQSLTRHRHLKVAFLGYLDLWRWPFALTE